MKSGVKVVLLWGRQDWWMDVKCLGGILVCREEYPKGFICSHIHSGPVVLAHADQIFASIPRGKPTRVFKPFPECMGGRSLKRTTVTPHGRGLPPVRSRVTRYLPEGPGRSAPVPAQVSYLLSHAKKSITHVSHRNMLTLSTSTL